ncbi:MAG: extracellular solute-binding protein [Proteobacteria bacterium]|nr:extracellular solute-binding protein [Pseudomonadota bacterium]MBI3495764.1 extracellular solute-binding protein [Pseudomonadota bacterium]
MKRRTFTTGLISLAALPLRRAHAAPPTDIKATLNVFRPATDADISEMNHAMARFKQRYPNVEIKVQYVATNPWGEYINQFMNALGSGESVDILNIATEGVATLVSRDVISDLAEILKTDPDAQELLADVEPNLLNALRYQNSLRLVPVEWNTVLTVYNTDMFQEAGLAPPAAGWKWNDLLETAQKLTKRDATGRITQYGYFVPGGQFALSTWFQTNDTDRLTPDGRQSNVKDPKFRESLVFLHDLIHKHKVAPTFTRNDPGYSPFAARQVAMISGLHPLMRILRDAKFTAADVQVVPYNRAQVNICGVMGMAMTKSTKNPALAWEFMKVLMDREYEAEVASNVRSIPSRRSAVQLPVWTAFPAHHELFYGAAAKAKPLLAPPNFAQVEEIMMRHVEAYMTGNQEIDATIDGMHEELSRAMSRVKW